MTRKRLGLLALTGLMTTICVHAHSAEQTRRGQIDALMSRYTGKVAGASLLVVQGRRARRKARLWLCEPGEARRGRS